MQCLSGGIKVEEHVQIREVVAQVAVTTWLTNIVRVQPCFIVRSGLNKVAIIVGRQAHRGVKLASSNHLLAQGQVLNHLIVCLLGHALDVVRVVHGHLGVILVLDQRVGKAIADAYTLQVNAFSAILQIFVSLEDTRRDSRGVVAVKLGDN